VSDQLVERERVALIGIAGLTVVTGAAQVLAPQASLEPLLAEDDPTTRHFFGTIGMFMVVVGGWLLDLLLRRPGDDSGLLWAAGQKVGAAGAVGLGVRRGIFSPLALVVAGFDALSGLLALDYWRRLRRG
jgi:hypothetical protein